MRNRVILIGSIAFAAFALGARAMRPKSKRPAEGWRHQLERLWNDPKSRRRRHRRAEQLKRDTRKNAKRLQRRAGRAAKHLRK